MAHEFEVSKEIELPATPEEVWDAIATGPGVDSWFMGRNEIEGEVGGKISLSVGGQTERSTVTAWEPGRRLAHQGDESTDGTFMAFEYLIEGRGGGSTTMRLVHSGFLGDDWETEYEAMLEGWDMYLNSLAAYLAHFRGRTGVPVFAARPQVGGRDRLWAAITERLGLTGTPKEGDAVRLLLPGHPPVEGIVDDARLPTFLGVRTDDGLYRFIHSGEKRGDVLVLGHHLFAEGVDPLKAEQAWQLWVGDLRLP